MEYAALSPIHFCSGSAGSWLRKLSRCFLKWPTASDTSWGPVIQTRGLNKACNHQLKDVFKGAALNAQRSGPIKDAYERLVAAGTKPNLARLTIARKIAAIVLAMWKTESEYRIMS